MLPACCSPFHDARGTWVPVAGYGEGQPGMMRPSGPPGPSGPMRGPGPGQPGPGSGMRPSFSGGLPPGVYNYHARHICHKCSFYCQRNNAQGSFQRQQEYVVFSCRPKIQMRALSECVQDNVISEQKETIVHVPCCRCKTASTASATCKWWAHATATRQHAWA